MTAKPSHQSRRPCYLRRTLSGFAPAGRGSQDIARRYGVGTILRAGHAEVARAKRGVVELPGSISFERMDQGEFRAFFGRAAAVITTGIIPGLNKDDLTRELDAMLGGRNP